MKATGIVRRIDDLGRIVIPKEIRRTMRIHEGDPLEIYTEHDGRVIFKKYSPIGELSEFACQYADSLSKATGLTACITDKDNIIAVSSNEKQKQRELKEKPISSSIERIMQSKDVFTCEDGSQRISITGDSEDFEAGVVAPIIYDGDPIGSVVFVKDDSGEVTTVEQKLAETAACFLGKTME